MEKISISRLVEKGISVHFMITDPSKDIRDRYRYNHAKYIVVDDEGVFISTDNFKDSSFPPSKVGSRSTTRGWVVSLSSTQLSNDLSSVFFVELQGHG